MVLKGHDGFDQCMKGKKSLLELVLGVFELHSQLHQFREV